MILVCFRSTVKSSGKDIFFFLITLRRHFRLNFKIKTFLRGAKSEAGMDVSGRLRVREVGKYKVALLQWYGIPWLQWDFPSAQFPPRELSKSLRHSLIPKEKVKILSKPCSCATDWAEAAGAAQLPQEDPFGFGKTLMVFRWFMWKLLMFFEWPESLILKVQEV